MARNILLLFSRILIAVLFLPSALMTLGDIAGSASYFTGLGVPVPTVAAWGVGLIELAGGLLVLLGLFARPAALLLALFCLAAGFIGHYGQGAGDPTLTFLHQQMLLKDIAIAGGLLALAAAGAGAWSLDRRPGAGAT